MEKDRFPKLTCSFCEQSLFHNGGSYRNHLSTSHFKEELLENFTKDGQCQLCHKKYKSGTIFQIVSHVGSTHRKVYDLMPRKDFETLRKMSTPNEIAILIKIENERFGIK